MCGCKYDKRVCHRSQCDCRCYDHPVKANISVTSLTSTAITVLNLTSECYSISNPYITIGTNSIIFSNLGVYELKGYIDITNQSTTATNFAIIANIISNTSVINPNSVTYSGLKISTPFSGHFNFVIQVTVPNTVLQLSARSTSVPTIISGGKIKIKKMQ